MLSTEQIQEMNSETRKRYQFNIVAKSLDTYWILKQIINSIDDDTLKLPVFSSAVSHIENIDKESSFPTEDIIDQIQRRLEIVENEINNFSIIETLDKIKNHHET